MGQDETLQASEAVRPILIAYLAGSLSPEQRDRFEFRLLEDDSFSRLVEEAEFALVEDFAADALPAADRQAIAPWIQASAARRAQVEIAQTLRKRQQNSASSASSARLQQAAKVVAFQRPQVQMYAAAAPAPASRVSPFQAPAAKKKSPLAWRFAVPLAMAAAVAVSVYVAKGHTGGPDSASNKPVMQQQQPEATGQPPAGTGAANGLRDDSADTIRLQAERIFGTKSAPATFDLRSGHPVQLQISVPTLLKGQSFSLRLHSPGHPDLDESQLHPITGVVPPTIEFTVPAGALQPGHYEGELKSLVGSFPLSFDIETH